MIEAAWVNVLQTTIVIFRVVYPANANDPRLQDENVLLGSSRTNFTAIPVLSESNQPLLQ